MIRMVAIFILWAMLAPNLLSQTKNAAEPSTQLPRKDQFHLYLLIGQSNMAGRGALETADKQPHARVLKFTQELTWAPAVDPLHFDKPIAGVGLGTSFGKIMADTSPRVTIGLVPCAVGGTPLSRWTKDGDLHQQALTRIKTAMKDGMLKGILWHQGESDAADLQLAQTYASRLSQMIRDLRAELGEPNVPFVAGKLGEFLPLTRNDVPSHWKLVNEQLGIAATLAGNAAVVDSAGLQHKGDDVHFDTPSLRELGKRYAVAMQKLANNTPVATPVIHPKAAQLPFAHQGPFLTTGDGAILCLEAHDALRSYDFGKTWTRTSLFKDPTKFQVSNERVVLRTRAGVIISSWMNLAERKAPANWNWGKEGADWQDFVLPIYVSRSLDDGKTWEEPILLNRPWCGCIHSMIETKSGRIVLVGQEIIPAWRHATVMFVSDDKGQSWRRSNVLDYGVGHHDHAGSIEGTVLERQDGTLYLLLRTESGWLWESTSRDGLTWENLKPSKLKSVTCCAQMGRLNDGRIALLWNHPPRHAPDSAGSREELSLALSSDDGATWTQPIVVAANYGPRNRVSYPYLYEAKPGLLWITTMQGNLRMSLAVNDVTQGEVPKLSKNAVAGPLTGGIVMFGDSTTAHRPGAIQKVYSVRVAEALQGVASSLTVHNAGVGGNMTEQALQRIERDVLAHQPRLVVIQFGINDSAIDVWRDPPADRPRVSLVEFEKNLKQIVMRVRDSRATPILMTANPLRWTAKLKELYGKPPYLPNTIDGFESPTLLPYVGVVRKVAKELDVPIVDIHKEFSSRSVDTLLLDGMHPNDQGHELIASLLVPVIRDLVR